MDRALGSGYRDCGFRSQPWLSGFSVGVFLLPSSSFSLPWFYSVRGATLLWDQLPAMEKRSRDQLVTVSGDLLEKILFIWWLRLLNRNSDFLSRFYCRRWWPMSTPLSPQKKMYRKKIYFPLTDATVDVKQDQNVMTSKYLFALIKILIALKMLV